MLRSIRTFPSPKSELFPLRSLFLHMEIRFQFRHFYCLGICVKNSRAFAPQTPPSDPASGQPMYSIPDGSGLKTLFKSLRCFSTKGKSQMENTGSPQDGTGIKNSTASAGKLQIRMTHFITYALKSAKYQENLPPKDMPAKFLISTRPPKFLRERQSRDQLF